jgi:hypothetical protein
VPRSLWLAPLCAAASAEPRHAARTSSDGLEAVLRLAAPASPMRHAVLRTAVVSSLGAVALLAARASTVRDAVRGAACSSRLGAALLLAALAPAMRMAMLRTGTSSWILRSMLHAIPMRMSSSSSSHGMQKGI